MKSSLWVRFLVVPLAAVLIIPRHSSAAGTTRNPSSHRSARFEDAMKEFVEHWDEDHSAKPEPARDATVEDVPRKDASPAPPKDSDAVGTVPSVSKVPSVPNKVEDVAEEGHSYPPLDPSKPEERNCTRCVPHEEARELRLAVIKAQILDKLRLSHPPNITRKMMLKLPPVNEMLNNLNLGGVMMSDSPSDDAYAGHFGTRLEEYEDDDEYHLNTQKIISLAQNPPKSMRHPKQMGTVFFNFAQNILSHHVAKADLWVKLNTNRLFTEYAPARLFIYQVFRAKGKADTTTLHLFREKKVDSATTKNGWIVLDIRKLVNHWFRRPQENLGLVIHLLDPEGQQLKVFSPEDQDNFPVPFIEVRVEASKHTRRKRSTGITCPENSKEVKCCRYPLTVDFEKFGWDWVIAPKRYEANYCSGECPYVFMQTYTHTHLVTQVNPQGSTGPCCAAKKLSGISMLYFNPEQSNIVLGMLPNMVVEECGCN